MQNCLASTGSNLFFLLAIGAVLLGGGLIVIRYAKARLAMVIVIFAMGGLLALGSGNKSAGASCVAPSPTTAPTTTSSTTTSSPQIPFSGTIVGLISPTQSVSEISTLPNPGYTSPSDWISGITFTQGSTVLHAVLGSTITDRGTPYDPHANQWDGQGQATFTVPGITAGTWTVSVSFRNTEYAPSNQNEEIFMGGESPWNSFYDPTFAIDGSDLSTSQSVTQFLPSGQPSWMGCFISSMSVPSVTVTSNGPNAVLIGLLPSTYNWC